MPPSVHRLPPPNRHTDNSRSPAPDIAVPRQALCYLSRSNRGLKNRRLFLQHPLFLALGNLGNHKPQNAEPSKRIVPWINIAFLRISGLLSLIHYHLALSGLVNRGSIIAKFTRVNPFTTAMTYMSYNEWDTKYNELRHDYNEWDTKCHDWQRITTNDHEWQRMTTNSTIDTRKYVIDTRNHWNILTAL